MANPAFENFIDQIRQSCEAKAHYINGIGTRDLPDRVIDDSPFLINNKWMLFKRIKGIIDIGNYDLDRQELNEELFNIYTQGGSQGKLLAASVQIQFLQALERALIHRRMTPPRALQHLRVRYMSHASDNGIFQDLLNQINAFDPSTTQTTSPP